MYPKLLATQWSEISQTSFAEIYNSNETQLLSRYLEKRVKHDLIRTLSRSGLAGEVFFTVRLKSEISTYIKLHRTNYVENQLKNVRKATSSGSQKYYLHEILTDIVGARIIAPDDEALTTILRTVVTAESMRIFDQCHFYKTNLSNSKRLSDLNSYVRQQIGFEFKIGEKSSLYESIHVIAAFNKPSDRFNEADYRDGANTIQNQRLREIIDLRDKLKETSSKMPGLIQSFPIELQFRTFNQHVWARAEHKFKYSRTKSGDDLSSISLDQLFVGLKYAFNHAENLLEKIETAASPEDSGLKLRPDGKSLTLGRRLHFFDVPEDRAEIMKINHMVDSIRDGPTEGAPEVINRLIKLYNKFSNSGTNANVTVWGKQRVVLLGIAFVLMYTANSKQVSKLVVIIRTSKNLTDALGISVLGAPLSHEIPERIYTHILSNDLYHNQSESPIETDYGSLFFDPLVYSRLATARYFSDQHFYAASTVDEFLNLLDGQTLIDWEHWNKAGIPSKEQFYVRWAEYLLFGSGLNPVYLKNNLRKVSELLVVSLNASADRPRQKAACWILIISTFATIKMDKVTICSSEDYRRAKDFVAHGKESTDYQLFAKSIILSMESKNSGSKFLKENRSKIAKNYRARPERAAYFMRDLQSFLLQYLDQVQPPGREEEVHEYQPKYS